MRDGGIESLLTEQRNPASAHIDELPTVKMLEVMSREDEKVAASVRKEIPQIARAVDAIVASFEAGGRLFYVGAGTSGRLGVLDASECPPTFNVSVDLVQGVIAGGEAALTRSTEASEDDPEAGASDLRVRGVRAGDVVAGIAASGRTPYVLGAIREARAAGARTIGISCTTRSELAAAVEIPITPLPGPEILTGSTRLKAGTATKLVLNMLTTGAMIRRGLVYGNLMVNVQPTNAKLADRARRVVRDATEVSESDAARYLEAAGNVVSAAIVMAKTGLTRNQSEDLLARTGGRIAAALQSASDQKGIETKHG